MTTNLKSILLSAAALSLVAAHGVPARGQEQSQSQANPAQEQSPTAKSAQPEVEADVAKRADEERKKIVADAETALDQTKKALALLGDKKTQEALGALEVATGKLELILARDPKLALAPVDTGVVIRDLYADPNAVKDAIKEARRLLGDGEVQKARPLVSNLASEVVFQTTNLPLAAYPTAIKSAASLIAKSKVDEAKDTLQAALNTLVITEVAVPLPVLRAQVLLKDAEKLAEDDKRSEESNKSLAAQLDEARKQIRMAEALGYGKKADFEPIFEQIKEIEQKSSGGKSGKGWFDRIKKQVSDLF